MNCKIVFVKLKNNLLKALILAYFLYNKPIQVKTDAFNGVLGGVLLQLYENNKWYLEIFWSEIIYIVKYNYYIYNKELLVII